MKTEGPKLQCSDCHHIYLDVMWQDCCPKCRSIFSTEVSEETELPDDVQMDVQNITSEDEEYVQTKDFSKVSISMITEEEPERISHGIEQPIEFLNEDIEQRRDILAQKDPVDLVSQDDRLTSEKKPIPEDIPLIAVNDTHMNSNKRLDPELYPPSAKYASAERRRRKRRASGMDEDNSEEKAVLQDAAEKTKERPSRVENEGDVLESGSSRSRRRQRERAVDVKSDEEVPSTTRKPTGENNDTMSSPSQSDNSSSEEFVARPRRPRRSRLSQDDISSEQENTATQTSSSVMDISDAEPESPRTRRPVIDSSEEVLESPRTRRRASIDSSEEELESPRTRRRAAIDSNEEELESPRTRRRAVIDSSEEELESPRTRRRAVIDSSEEELESPRTRRRPVVDSHEEELEKPRTRRRPGMDSHEEEPESPRTRRRSVTDSSEKLESPSIGRRSGIESNEEEENPRSRRSSVMDTSEEEFTSRSGTGRREIEEDGSRKPTSGVTQDDESVSRFSRRNRATMDPLPEQTKGTKLGKEPKEPKLKKEKEIKEPKVKKGLFSKKVEEPQPMPQVRQRKSTLSGTHSPSVSDEEMDFHEEVDTEKRASSHSEEGTSKFSRRSREIPQEVVEPKRKGLFGKK